MWGPTVDIFCIVSALPEALVAAISFVDPVDLQVQKAAAVAMIATNDLHEIVARSALGER